MSRRLGVLVVICTAIVVMVLSAASGASGKTALTSVSFRTGIDPGPYDAAFFVARDLGYYKKAGLDVDIAGGLGSTSNVQLVAAGKVDFASIYASSIILAAAQGIPVRAIASGVQIGGGGIATQTSITSVSQMAGKTLGLSPFDAYIQLIPAFEQAAGLPAGSIKLVSTATSNDALALFMAGKLDMTEASGWSFAPLLQSNNYKFNYFPFSKYGVDVMGPTIAASTSTVRNRPAIARAFAVATMRGWAYALANPGKAAAIFDKDVPNQITSNTVNTLKDLKAYAHTPNTAKDPLGWMSPKDWVHTALTLEKYSSTYQGSAAKPGLNQLFTNVIPLSAKKKK